MGRNKVYTNPFRVAAIEEQENVEDLRAAGITSQEVWNAGMKIILPIGMGARQFRIMRIPRQIAKLEKEKAERVEEISEEYDPAIEALKKELMALTDSAGKLEEDIQRLWAMFRRENPNIKEKPRWSPDDRSIHPWWEGAGLPLSYGEIVRRWDREGVL